ncbi:MAG: hypothetical protein ACRDBO_11470 [Lachnospiraceae bacterium]
MTPKQRRDAAALRQQAIVNAAKNDGNRSLTVAEQAEFDTLQRDIDQATAEIEAEERGLAGNAGAPAAPPAATQQEGQQATQRAVAEERSRVAEITALCRDFDTDPAQYIANGSTMDQVRAAILSGMRATGTPVGVQVTRDEGDTFRERASDALMLRAGVQAQNLAEGAGELRAMSLRDLAIECLSREGQDARTLLRTDPDAMYNDLCRQFYNPTAAFPAILDSTIRKSIVHLYNAVPTTFQAWTAKGSLKDFKKTSDHEYAIGGTGDFLKVPENGELKANKPSTELLPNRQLDTYGRQFSMSRQAFINDDIGFLTEVPGLYAARAKKTIDKQVYTLLYNNQKTYDGINLFEAVKHKNLMATGAKPSQATIQAMILQMQKQKDPFGEAIYMTPQHMILPVGYEFDMAVILHSTQVTGSNNNDINPLYNYPLNVVQTPVLNVLAGTAAAPWFMVANQMSAKSIQVDYLNGQETPTVRRMEVAGVLGFTWDIYLDWGISVRDYRGIYKNPGEVIA